MGLLNKTKPLIGQLQMEEVLKVLEDKVNAVYGEYMEQLDTKAKLEEENKAIENEKKALIAQLEAEQGNLSEYTERQAKASAMKADLEVEIAEQSIKLTETEGVRHQATSDKKDLETENIVIKKDIEDLELAIQKLEQEKSNRDHTIRTLTDEVSN